MVKEIETFHLKNQSRNSPLLLSFMNIRIINYGYSIIFALRVLYRYIIDKSLAMIRFCAKKLHLNKRPELKSIQSNLVTVILVNRFSVEELAS